MASVGEKLSIAGSVAKDGDAYSPHRTGEGVHSNEWDGVPLESLRNLTWG